MKEGLAFLDADDGNIDAASIDIRLQDGVSFPVAEQLAGTGTPMLFVSGTVEELPSMFTHHPALSKPVTAHRIIKALTNLTADHTTYGRQPYIDEQSMALLAT